MSKLRRCSVTPIPLWAKQLPVALPLLHMPQHLGILGGGQLGRMLALAAHPLGIRVTVLEPNPDAPARAVATHIQASYDDHEGLSRLGDCDVVTFEFENIPEAAARALSEKRAVYPPHEALRVSQDRVTEKSTFQSLGIETAQFRQVDNQHDAIHAFAELGPIVLKTRRFGYDGKGQAIARTKEEVSSAHASLGGAPAIAEQLIPFDRELSIIACRTLEDEVRLYPLTENYHQGGILRRSIAPAPAISSDVARQASEMVTRLLNHLNYVGVIALELFLVGERLLANEFAPRVHNSGHWTIEGAVTSQFENHVRAVCGLPLGDTSLRSPCVMTNLIGEVPRHADLLEIRDTHLHDYDKAARAGRKVGHVTSLGPTPEAALEAANQVRALIEGS